MEASGLVRYRKAWRLVTVLGATLGALVFTQSALADSGTPFGCRASTLRVTLLSSITTEPTIANPNTTPCSTDTAGVAAVSVPTTGQSVVDAGPVGAFTFSVFNPGGGTAPGATAVAAVQGVTIPTGGGGSISLVGPIEAAASYACVNGTLVANASSTLNLLAVNGQNQTVPAGQPTRIDLGGGSFIALNQKVQTSTSLTETVAEINLQGIADIVIGEAKVTQSVADPCAGTSGVPPVLEICPPGSSLSIAAQLCEIHACGTVIVVSRPFQGPSGGTVIALCTGRFKGFPCTTGPGPKFALVATKQGVRVYGTPKSDRILAFGAFERIAGLGGNDCIDGAGRTQTIFDGNGKDKVYGGPGRTRIGVGQGNDYVNGRRGSDWITASNGQDTIIGGRGNSRIDVGLGHSHILGGPGKNRIFAGANGAKVRCGSGHNNTAFVRSAAAHFARTHGCQHIHLLN